MLGSSIKVGGPGIDNTPTGTDALTGVAISSNAFYDHAADLDAHTRNLFQLIRTGNYFAPAPLGAAGGGFGLDANRLFAIPFIVARNLTIDRLAIHVGTGVAGSARLGIYNDGTNLYPGTLLKDVGVVDVTTAGIKAATITGNLALTKGLYHLVALADVTPTVRDCSLSWSPYGHSATEFAPTAELGRWEVAQTYGALPDPFPAGGAQGITIPIILPRLLSLD